MLMRPARHPAGWRITTIDGILVLQLLTLTEGGRDRWRNPTETEKLSCPAEGWLVSDAASDEWED